MTAYDIFVSYAHDDGEAVGRLVRAMADAGISMWLDRTDIATFASITGSIEDGL